MPFEVFTSRGVQTTKNALISIQKGGVFTLNQAALDALGNPEAVELLFDRERRLIGFRPANTEQLHIYRVNKQPESRTYLISGAAFLQFYDVPYEQTRRYAAKIVDEVLCIDLQDNSISTYSRGRKNGHATAE